MYVIVDKENRVIVLRQSVEVTEDGILTESECFGVHLGLSCVPLDPKHELPDLNEGVWEYRKSGFRPYGDYTPPPAPPSRIDVLEEDKEVTKNRLELAENAILTLMDFI